MKREKGKAANRIALKSVPSQTPNPCWIPIPDAVVISPGFSTESPAVSIKRKRTILVLFS